MLLQKSDYATSGTSIHVTHYSNQFRSFYIIVGHEFNNAVLTAELKSSQHRCSQLFCLCVHKSKRATEGCGFIIVLSLPVLTDRSFALWLLRLFPSTALNVLSFVNATTSWKACTEFGGHESKLFQTNRKSQSILFFLAPTYCPVESDL